jgi:hypothetical protein
MKLHAVALAAVFGANLCAAASCPGATMTLPDAKRTSYAQAAERHLRSKLPPDAAARVTVSSSDVLSYTKLGNWVVLHIETHSTDPPYLFYSAAPDKAASYVSLWAGAARKSEAQEIKLWVLRNVHGSKRELAVCFSSMVTSRTPT